jgi:hypothetical protein
MIVSVNTSKGETVQFKIRITGSISSIKIQDNDGPNRKILFFHQEDPYNEEVEYEGGCNKEDYPDSGYSNSNEEYDTDDPANSGSSDETYDEENYEEGETDSDDGSGDDTDASNYNSSIGNGDETPSESGSSNDNSDDSSGSEYD